MRARKRVFAKFIVTALTLLGSAALVAGPLWASTPSVPPAAGSGSVSKAQVAEGYGRLPLFFTENQGQADPQVKFYTRGQGHAIFFTPEAMVLSLNRTPGDVKRNNKKAKDNQALVQLRPQGIRPGVEIVANEPLPGKVNYYQGNDPAKWRTGVPTFKSVVYREAYPGIDLKFYGTSQNQVEYDLVVKPGADPKQVKFLYEGIKSLKVGKAGDLIITLPDGGKLVQQKPVIYQEINGQRVSREGKFRLLPGKRSYGFELASYDNRHPLIIDPVVLVYSTYLEGSIRESGNSIAVDIFDEAFVVGSTQSLDFPRRFPSQNVFGGVEDAFVTKFNVAGNALVFSTYLGGVSEDVALGVAVDSIGDVFVTGYTFSFNFPMALPPSPAPFQNSLQGFESAFFTHFNGSNGTIAYSTFLGGSNSASGPATGSSVGKVIAIDGADNAYIAGETNSTNFPLAGASVQTAPLNGATTVFISKFNPHIAGAGGLLYSTYLGGSVGETPWGIAVNDLGTAIYVAGETQSPDFPLSATPFQNTNNGFTNAFVSRINPAVSGLAGLTYSTYLGRSGTPVADSSITTASGGVAVDAAGNAYVSGNTDAIDFFTTAGAFQTTPQGAVDAFVTKFNPTGTPVYSTFLGGSGDDVAWFTAVDATGNAYITGETGSLNFPLLMAFQSINLGAPTAFVTKLNPAGAALVFSTYLGGSAQNRAFGIALDTVFNPYVTGLTTSADFPTKNAFQATLALTSQGGAFVTKLKTGAPVLTGPYLLLLLDD